MNVGKSIKVDWDSLRSPYASLDLTQHPPNSWETCGSATLALLTGLTPKYIDKLRPKNREHWGVGHFVKFLKNRGFTVREVTLESVVNVYWEQFPIIEDHVVVFTSRMDKDDASYFIMYKGSIWHNQYEMPYNPLFFINKPTQHVFVITRPKWQKPPKKTRRNK